MVVTLVVATASRRCSGSGLSLALSGESRQRVRDTVDSVSLDYAADELTAAVRSLAAGETPLAERLQAVWDDHVQMIWMKPCLTADLLRDFRDFWQRYTAPSDDRRSTKLRTLTDAELVQAIDELVALSTRTAVVAAGAPAETKFATLADLA